MFRVIRVIRHCNGSMCLKFKPGIHIIIVHNVLHFTEMPTWGKIVIWICVCRWMKWWFNYHYVDMRSIFRNVNNNWAIQRSYSPAHELLSTRIFANIREFSRIFANEKKKKKKKKNYYFFFFFFFLCFI